MNIKITIIALVTLLSTTNLFSQETKYRRSSLTNILVESDGLGKSQDMVIKAYYDNPFPDKYNDHVMADKKFDLNGVTLTNEDYINAGLMDTLNSAMKIKMAEVKQKKLKYLNDEKTLAVILPSKNEEFQAKLSKFIKEKQLAKQVVASWFNRKADGTMDWELIKKRGLYSASEDDKEDANISADPINALLDFGLIGNTFTVFNNLEFYANEPVAAVIRDAAKEVAKESLDGFMLEKSLKGIDAAYEKGKEGYTVKCNTYLYQLEWDEKIAENFKNMFFNDNFKDKVNAWDTTQIMNLKFIGKSTSMSIVTFKIGEKRTEEEIITLQVKRAIDNSLAKLQKQNAVFRPISPVYSTGPVTARIGLKEGVEPKQKFEILESFTNKMGFPDWKVVGNVSVDKENPIWDNRQGAEIAKDENGDPLPEYTIFKGGKKAMVGMNYIRASK